MAKKQQRTMNARQCEIAAESYAASLLARTGYDVLVQYGANQPHYDLMAVKGPRFLLISVKGSQDGGWMLSVKDKRTGGSYHDAIDAWLGRQRKDAIFFFVQYRGVALHELPRAYVATPGEVAKQLKKQCDGRGYGSLQEDIKRDRPKGKYTHKIPEAWRFTASRIDKIKPSRYGS